MIKRICVYCASSSQIDNNYIDEAHSLGQILAKAGITTVYGGGSVGLMGALARGVLQNNGTLVGVIPKFMMELEWGNPDVSEMNIVETMAQRKHMLLENVDAVIALPGGTGTLEELAEVLSLKKLALFTKPIIILNTNNFYDYLVAFLNKMVDEKFIRNELHDLYFVAENAGSVIPLINSAPIWSNDRIKFATF